ncbi:Xaa-Pro aminopeptidase [Mycoplasma testudineum]|uniref:Xaa-Pro aminopeptidase n=1 Tax=Mycoplasma testudineum TaxID=244584 RepID=A0A4R6IFY6_9MOLU|nr:aminopeptidase P family protein [Mycoplasma testudineum]OYD26704.1 Xaa-Pro aminopeptidase [Mycoplasma testudineum]TDO19835.1 Xaa-Pro aminopeptidase [Mycoplasma testudineum]
MTTIKVKQLIKSHKNVEALISFAPQTRLWYANVATTDGILIIEPDNAYLFVDSRYIEYATKKSTNVQVILLEKNSFKKFLTERKYKEVLVEKEYLLLEQMEMLQAYLPKIKFKSISGKNLRIKKTNEEIELVKKAIEISLLSYNKVRNQLQVGQTEKEVAALLEYEMQKNGAEKESFESIIAFGPSAAEPHHHPTDRKLKDGDIVKMDFGAQYNGYAADITRTFMFGDSSKFDPKLVEIIKIVEEAAYKGIELVKPGISTKEVDKACRDHIKKAGYEKQFLHSTGHGLGIDVHESPNVSTASETILEPGMIITVEPGIYIQDLGGARLENDILVTEDGYINLSKDI